MLPITQFLQGKDGQPLLDGTLPTYAEQNPGVLDLVRLKVVGCLGINRQEAPDDGLGETKLRVVLPYDFKTFVKVLNGHLVRKSGWYIRIDPLNEADCTVRAAIYGQESVLGVTFNGKEVALGELRKDEGSEKSRYVEVVKAYSDGSVGCVDRWSGLEKFVNYDLAA